MSTETLCVCNLCGTDIDKPTHVGLPSPAAFNFQTDRLTGSRVFEETLKHSKAKIHLCGSCLTGISGLAKSVSLEFGIDDSPGKLPPKLRRRRKTSQPVITQEEPKFPAAIGGVAVQKLGNQQNVMVGKDGD